MEKISEKLGGANVFHTKLTFTLQKLDGFQQVLVFYRKLFKRWQKFPRGSIDNTEYILSQSLRNKLLVCYIQ